MHRLGRDVLAVLDALGIEKINWCGLSMGGMVGMWLGANAADRIDKLILSNTSAYFADKVMWDGRIKMVREKGLTAKVSFIARSAEYTPPVIYSQEERAKLVFLIEARPEQPDKFRVGQPVTVTLRQESS